MPSVLIELGFLTHREECVFIASETGQNILAESIFFAFRDFVEKNASNNQEKTIEPETTNRIEEVDNTPSVGSGTTYKVQLFATGKELPSNHAIYSVFNSITTEAIGSLSRILTESTSSKAEALRWIGQANAAGYEDAYIVTYLNGIRQ